MEMDANIKLKSALDILKRKYEKEYAKYTSVDVVFDLEYLTHTYTDWGGFTDTDEYYALYANIYLSKQIGDIVAEGCIKKDATNLKSDLINELRKVFFDDEYEIYSVDLPEYNTNKIDLDSDVSIWFNEKSKRLNKELVK